MRFCIPVPCFFRDCSFEDALRTIGKLGFDAAETYNWKNLNLESVADAVKESGVELVSMCTTCFDLTNPASREAFVAGVRESVVAANKVGAKKLITQVGQDTGARREFQHESIVKGLKAAAPILEDAGVTLMIEPLNTYFNHPGYYLWSAVEGFQIAREVGSKHVAVIYDIYHQQIMEGNIIPNITNNLDVIAHMHCAGHPGRHELQYGENDYKVIFAAVDKAGYKGCMGLEYGPLTEPIESLNEFKRIYMA